MTKKLILPIILVFVIVSSMNAQTIGLYYNTPESYDGYTLFSPLYGQTTYLINNCGEMVNSWVSEYLPGASVYFLENGMLLRTGNKINKSFPEGGSGGIIEMMDWEGNIVWNYILSDEQESLHHDIEVLPNGNILALVWEVHTKEEATTAGRAISPDILWSEKIIEIKPNLKNGGGEIIWQWNTWDHLVQNIDEEAENFGNISSPQLININFSTRGFKNSDWLHFNSIDYNPKLDQILISNHNFSEIWIIDHSTTTQEATTHEGGNSGIGGDIMYRWGNPRAYGRGTEDDRKLFLQHDPHWISDSLKDGNKIMIFNNQAGTVEDMEYSSVLIIEPPIDEMNNYNLEGESYGPNEAYWDYFDEPKTDFYGMAVSGAQRLPNGNTLICSGWQGIIFEIDSNKNKVWKYVSPISLNGSIGEQGDVLNFNQIFRAERFPPSYSGLKNKDLTPKGYIETGSEFTCQLFGENTSAYGYIDNSDIGITIENSTLELKSYKLIEKVEIYNSEGKRIAGKVDNSNSIILDISGFSNGIYFGIITQSNERKHHFKFLVD